MGYLEYFFVGLVMCFQVFISAALMEYYCSKVSPVPSKLTKLNIVICEIILIAKMKSLRGTH